MSSETPNQEPDNSSDIETKNNMTSESSNQEPDSLSDEEKSRRFERLQFILDLDYKMWTHYSEFLYSQQMSAYKNYLWLTVTILTGCFALYSEFVSKSFQCDSFSFHYGKLFLGISIVISLITSLIGVIGLSSLFFKDKPVDPYDGGKDYVERFEFFNTDSEEAYNDLKNLDIFYCNSISISRNLINKKGILLRIANIAIIISTISVTISGCCFLLNKMAFSCFICS